MEYATGVKSRLKRVLFGVTTHFESQGQRQPLEQGEDGTFVRNENGETTTLLWHYDGATQLISIPQTGNMETYTLNHLTKDELVLQSFSKDFGEVNLILKRIN